MKGHYTHKPSCKPCQIARIDRPPAANEVLAKRCRESLLKKPGDDKAKRKGQINVG